MTVQSSDTLADGELRVDGLERPDLSDLVAIVTGASGGLGSAVAAKLLAVGLRVALVDIHQDPQSRISQTYPTSSLLLRADLGSTEDCDRVVAETVSRWGRLDILVNCAATLSRSEFGDLDETLFERVMNTNFRSVVWLSRAALPHMRTRRWGRIVNVTSVGIHTGGYRLTSAVYEASKGAVHNFTKTLARAVAQDGILVNSVAPGGMSTPMILEETPPEVIEEVLGDIPLGRLADPAEVAELVVFLASPANTYSTGGSFDVNGGTAMS